MRSNLNLLRLRRLTKLPCTLFVKWIQFMIRYSMVLSAVLTCSPPRLRVSSHPRHLDKARTIPIIKPLWRDPTTYLKGPIRATLHPEMHKHSCAPNFSFSHHIRFSHQFNVTIVYFPGDTSVVMFNILEATTRSALYCIVLFFWIRHLSVGSLTPHSNAHAQPSRI